MDTTGFTQISVSHELNPLMKLVSRGDTTVADAYLSPVLCVYPTTGSYLRLITRPVSRRRIMVIETRALLHYRGYDVMLRYKT